MLNITKILQGTPTQNSDNKNTQKLNITKILQGTPTLVEELKHFIS